MIKFVNYVEKQKKMKIKDFYEVLSNFHPSSIDWMDEEDFKVIIEFYKAFKIEIPYFYCVLLSVEFMYENFECLTCPFKKEYSQDFYNYIQEWNI